MTWIVERIRTAVVETAIVAFFAVVSSCFFATHASSTSLTRYPYVNLVTDSSATIAWHTDTATTGTVVYSKDLVSTLSATDAVTDTIHAVTIAGLDTAQVYFYRVVAGTDTLTNWNDNFYTAPAPTSQSPFFFAVLGDLGAATTAQTDVAAQINATPLSFVILPGDIIYDAGEPQNFDPQVFQIYQASLAIMPFYTAMGDHDVGTANGQPYLDNFYLPTNSATHTERYYSFDYGITHFVALEVTQENTKPDAAMLTWLDQDLANSTAKWKFVYFDVPAYSNSGAHGGDATIAAALEPIFMSRGVDVVFQAHNNFYTRTYPLVNGVPADQGQEPNYINPSGPIWITTGGGGHALDPIAALSPIEAFSISDNHHLFAVVSGPVLAIQAESSTNNNDLDLVTITKTSTTAITLAGFVAVGEPEGVLLRWQRVDGGSDGGFNVYRGLDSAGPWTRLNPDLLRGTSSFEYLDRDGEAGVAYTYRLGIVDGQGRETAGPAISASRQGPLRFALDRPRPNPARGSTLISFTLEKPAPTRVLIVDVSGRVVRTLASRTFPAGAQALTWDGRDAGGREAASGIYFAVVSSGEHEARTRVALLR